MNFLVKWYITRRINQMDFLAGYKTYIAAAGLAVATGLYALGMITEDIYDKVFGFTVALGGFGIAKKIDRK